MIIKIIRVSPILTNVYANGELVSQHLWREMEADVLTPAGNMIRVIGDEDKIISRFG